MRDMWLFDLLVCNLAFQIFTHSGNLSSKNQHKFVYLSFFLVYCRTQTFSKSKTDKQALLCYAISWCTDGEFEFRSLPPRLVTIPRLMNPVCVAVFLVLFFQGEMDSCLFASVLEKSSQQPWQEFELCLQIPFSVFQTVMLPTQTFIHHSVTSTDHV